DGGDHRAEPPRPHRSRPRTPGPGDRRGGAGRAPAGRGDPRPAAVDEALTGFGVVPVPEQALTPCQWPRGRPRGHDGVIRTLLKEPSPMAIVLHRADQAAVGPHAPKPTTTT